MHEGPGGGHFGVAHVQQKLSSYYWPSLVSDVKYMQEMSKDEETFNFKAQGFIETYTSTFTYLCTDWDGSYTHDIFCERIQLHYYSRGLLIQIL